MNEGHWYDLSLPDLTPEQRVWLDQALRAEGIPATWGGTTLRVDVAYEARLGSLVEEARASLPYLESPPSPATWSIPHPSGPAPVPYDPGQPATKSTNTKAVVALVLGIASVVLACGCPPLALLGVAAIVVGIGGRKEVQASGGRQSGEGLAIGGIACGGIALAIGTVVLLAVTIPGMMR